MSQEKDGGESLPPADNVGDLEKGPTARRVLGKIPSSDDDPNEHPGGNLGNRAHRMAALPSSTSRISR